jgi:hypothetical protein
MNLSWSGYRFNLSCTPAEKDIPKQLGFHFDFQKKIWWTGVISVAKQLEAYSDASAKARFGQEKQQIQLSSAVDTSDLSLGDYEIPAPKGKDYLPFQKAGILVCLSRLGFDISKLKKSP